MMTERAFKLLCENLLIFIVILLSTLLTMLLVLISRIQSLLSYWSIKCSNNINDKILKLSEERQYIKFKINIYNNFENIRNNITNFINTVTWYPIHENVFNYIENESIYHLNKEDPFKDIPFWVLPMVPPSDVLIFGKHIIDKNYKQEMYEKYPLYTVGDIINSLLGNNVEFPSYEEWLESKYDDEADDEADEDEEENDEEENDESDEEENDEEENDEEENNSNNSDELVIINNIEATDYLIGGVPPIEEEPQVGIELQFEAFPQVDDDDDGNTDNDTNDDLPAIVSDTDDVENDNTPAE